MKVTHTPPAAIRLTDCRNCTVRENSLCSDFTNADFSIIHTPIQDMRFLTGAFVYRQGDKVNGIHTIRSGMVKLNRLNPDGTQRILRILRAGDVIGLEASMSLTYENDAIAISPLRTCRIPIDVIHRLEQESPRLRRKLMEKWHSTLREADEWFAELTNGLARVRMARLLLKMRDPAQENISVLFSLEDIGSMLGMTIETASRIINALLREHIITRLDTGERHYKINVAALQLEAQSSAD